MSRLPRVSASKLPSRVEPTFFPPPALLRPQRLKKTSSRSGKRLMNSGNTKPPLLQAIATRVLLGDGAMGTQLQQAGLEPGGWGDEWNLTYPDRVASIQKRYADAGSDCLITNTFGTN